MSDTYIRTGQFMQYTGANGPAIATWYGAPIMTDDGQTLILGVNPADPSLVMEKNQWFSTLYGVWAHSDFTRDWFLKASMNPNPTGTSDIVSVAVPTLLLNASVDRVVTWARPFPDTSYKVSFAYDAGTLGRATAVVKSGTKTTTGLTVTISAGLAVTLASVIHVLGTT